MPDLVTFIRTVGYVGVAFVIFSETGLLVGFFLPGDSLLFTAGFLASQNYLNIYILAPLCFLAAVLGNSTGYLIGRRFGPNVFNRPTSALFNRTNVERTEEFYAKHGPKTIVLAQFLPIVRTFAPVMAGVGNMSYARFFVYNIIGALFWASGITILGYGLGQTVPNADQYILPIVLLIIAISVAPTLTHILKDPLMRTKLLNQLRRWFKPSKPAA